MGKIILALLAFWAGWKLGKHVEKEDIRELKISKEEGQRIIKKVKEWQQQQQNKNWNWNCPE